MKPASMSYLPYLSLVVAGLSLGSSMFQGYSYTRQLDIAQRNVIRGEYLRTCRDIIDAYFQIKMRSYAMNEAVGTSGRGPEAVDPLIQRHLPRQFPRRPGARALHAAVLEAAGHCPRNLQAPRADFDKAYAEADVMFGEVNEDCAKTARLSFL
jgi:hypothetical protein